MDEPVRADYPTIVQWRAQLKRAAPFTAFSGTPPAAQPTFHILTEGGDILVTETGQKLKTEEEE